MSILKFANLLRSEKGFSLTEIMIGGGILAGVALAGAQMFKDQKSAQKKIDDLQKLTIFHQALAKKMANSSNCNATFKAAGRINGSIPQGLTLDWLKLCGSNCNEGGGNLDHRAADVGVGGNLVQKDVYIDNTQLWRIKSIVHPSASRNTSGPIILRVTYEVNPKLTGGVSKTVSKDLVVHARFDGGGFQECVSNQESSINNLQSDFCKSLNFGNISSTGTEESRLATWDEETQTCIVGADVNCSEQGYIVDGVDSTGKVKCRKLTTPYDADLLHNPASQTCGTGLKPTLQYSNGKFKIVCQ